jgi:hypothetical protein
LIKNQPKKLIFDQESTQQIFDQISPEVCRFFPVHYNHIWYTSF